MIKLPPVNIPVALHIEVEYSLCSSDLSRQVGIDQHVGELKLKVNLGNANLFQIHIDPNLGHFYTLPQSKSAFHLWLSLLRSSPLSTMLKTELGDFVFEHLENVLAPHFEFVETKHPSGEHRIIWVIPKVERSNLLDVVEGVNQLMQESDQSAGSFQFSAQLPMTLELLYSTGSYRRRNQLLKNVVIDLRLLLKCSESVYWEPVPLHLHYFDDIPNKADPIDFATDVIVNYCCGRFQIKNDDEVFLKFLKEGVKHLLSQFEPLLVTNPNMPDECALYLVPPTGRQDLTHVVERKVKTTIRLTESFHKIPGKVNDIDINLTYFWEKERVCDARLFLEQDGKALCTLIPITTTLILQKDAFKQPIKSWLEHNENAIIWALHGLHGLDDSAIHNIVNEFEQLVENHFQLQVRDDVWTNCNQVSLIPKISREARTDFVEHKVTGSFELKESYHKLTSQFPAVVDLEINYSLNHDEIDDLTLQVSVDKLSIAQIPLWYHVVTDQPKNQAIDDWFHLNFDHITSSIKKVNSWVDPIFKEFKRLIDQNFEFVIIERAGGESEVRLIPKVERNDLLNVTEQFSWPA